MEHTKDAYNFSLIKEDLKFLKKSKEKLFVQIQDVSFSPQRNFAPKYLREEPIYNGGANKTYSFKDYDETEYTHEGWATRRWSAEVKKRIHKLYAALRKEFDGIVEGVNTEGNIHQIRKRPQIAPARLQLFAIQRGKHEKSVCS